MRRHLGWAIPAVLGVVGIALLLIGTGPVDEVDTPSLPPILAPSGTPVAAATTAPPATSAPTQTPTSTPLPTRTPLPADAVAEQLEIASVGINVVVKQSLDAATNNFPPRDAAYILMGSSQPGQNTNSYIFAHANETLFRPLWNVQLGAEVLVRMSEGTVLRYVVTEVHQNVPCPDPNADPGLNPPDPPLALTIHEDCAEGVFWLGSAPHERLTLQTSQGFNRNWGEFVVVAKPAP